MAGPYNPAIKNQAWQTRVSLNDMTAVGSFKASPTIAAGDWKVDIDGAGFNNLTNLPSVSPAAGVAVLLDMTAAQMNGDVITLVGIDQTSPKEWADFRLTIHTTASGVTLSAASIQAIWDALTSALSTAGSIGKRIADFLTGDAFVRLGAPAGASVSVDVAAIKVDSAAVKLQTDKLAFTVTNQVDANVLDWKSATAPAMTGDAFARLGAPAGASVSADVAAVKVDSAAIKLKTDSLAFTVANQVDSNVIDWKGAVAPAMTGDAFARLGASGAGLTALGDTRIAHLDADVSTRLASTSYTAPDNADILLIKAKTDNLPSDPADESLIIAATDAVMTRLGAPVGASLSADVAGVQSDTNDIQARLPAALIGGRIDATVGAMQAGVVTAAAVATDAIDADALAADAVTEIQAGLSTLAAGDIPAAVWDEPIAGHLTAGTTGAALDSASTGGDPWATALPGAYAAGTAGKILGDNLDAKISTRTKPADTQAAVTLVATTTTVTNDVGITQAAADKVWTSAARTLTSFGTLVADAAAAVWASGARTLTGYGTLVADVATAVWAAATRILTAGTNIVLAKDVGVTGFNDLNAAGVRSAVGLGAANLDVQLAALDDDVLTRLPTSSYVAPDNVGIAAIETKTDNLPDAPMVNTAGKLWTLDGNGNPIAAAADVPTAAANADALLGRNLAGGSDGGRTVQDALRPLRNKTSVDKIAKTLTVMQEDDATEAWIADVTFVPRDALASVDPQ